MSDERIRKMRQRRALDTRLVTPSTISGIRMGKPLPIKQSNAQLKLMVLREIISHLIQSRTARMSLTEMVKATVYPSETLRPAITLGTQFQVLEYEYAEIILTNAGLRWHKGDLPIAGLNFGPG